MTPTELVLALHTDVANLKTYDTTAPAVTRALIAEAEAKINAISDHIICVRRSPSRLGQSRSRHRSSRLTSSRPSGRLPPPKRNATDDNH